ncbi:response regulator transcription factor [Emticicia sp. BO119]|uniref:response regulator n=1 Tax=Emticicia sp. BO119 TaxID=2757768 RepID=UPI0015F049EC|nr:response regulator transcription factor [Emticicia sp. BO119]MBA4853230.1 response regulator transcription factor [Emticicia sp. BO119]
MQIRVLIADDHIIVAESLGFLIDTMDGIEVVGIKNSGWQVLTFLEGSETDIVLIDYHMPLMNGIETTIRIREKYPNIKVMLLTMSEEPAIIKEALIAGAAGYIVKKIEKTELEIAIKTVASGKKYLSDEAVMKLAEIPNLNTPSGTEEVSVSIPITPREIEILKLIVQEFSNAEIAQKIYISPTTVETHRRNLMKKLGVNSALGLYKYAQKHGLID